MTSDSKAVVLGLNETLVIAGLPALGYWMAYLYQLGYCKFFDIPPEFIDITLVNVLIAIVGTAFAFGALQMAIDPFVMLSQSLSRQLRFSVLKMLALGLFLGGGLLISKADRTVVLIIVGFYGLLLVSEFLYPLLTQRNVQGYANKLAAQTALDNRTNNTMDLIGEAVGARGMLMFLTFWALSVLGYFAGGFEARTKSDFMVVGYTTRSVVVKSVGDTYVVARFDSKAKTLAPEFSLVSRKDDLEFTSERVGPLQPLGPKQRKEMDAALRP